MAAPYTIAGEQADLTVGNNKVLVQPERTRLEQDSPIYLDLTTTATVTNRVVVLEITDSADVVLGSITIDAALAPSTVNAIYRIFPGSGDGELPFPVPVDGKLVLRDTSNIDVLDTFKIRLFYNRVGPVVPG